MMASVDLRLDTLRTEACQALADEILSKVPAQAESRNLPVGRVVRAIWLTLCCDLIGDDADAPAADALFELARHTARRASACSAGCLTRSR